MKPSIRLTASLLSAAILLLPQSCKKDNPAPLPVMPERKAQTFNLENEVVARYMDQVYSSPYKDNDYSYTYIESYYQTNTSYRKDRPAAVSLSWNRASGATYQTVTISSDELFTSPSYSCSIPITSNKTEIYNLIPGRKYYYKVEADTPDGKKIEDSFHFYTTGRRRMLNIDGIFNVRDLGGIKTADGTKRIRYGWIFRGGRMNYNDIAITEEGKKAMRQAGIAADLDLRKDDESGKITSSPLGSGIQYKRFPTSSKGYYEKIRTADGKVNIQEMQWLIDQLKASRPVYFHCAVGADRTGTLGFLIESLLGVSELDMSIDYELTSFSAAGYRPRKKAKYDYPGMVAAMKTVSGSSLQEKCYSYFLNGIGGVKISKDDLDWFIGFMLEDAG